MGAVEPTRQSARRRLILAVLASYIAAWLIGIAYAAILRSSGDWDAGAEWERSLLRTSHVEDSPAWLDRLMLMLPLTGTNLTLLPLTIVVGWWLWKRKGRPADGVQLFIVSLGSLSINVGMKYLLDRSRPDLFPRRGMYNWASYPSGHVMVTTALYFTVALMLYRDRRWRWPFAAATIVLLANAQSRLYLAVHWPTDLIGGTLIGVVWLAGTWFAFDWYTATTAGRSDGAATIEIADRATLSAHR